MTFKTNINPQGRGFFFADSGDDLWDGGSVETPKKTIQSAIDAAAILSPIPSFNSPAVVSEAQGGSFNEALVLPDSVQLVAESSAIVTSTAVAVTLGSAAACRIQTVINSQDSSTCHKIDGKISVGLVSSFCGVNGNNSTGLELSGACDDIFIDVSEISLGGDNCKGMDVTASSPTPIDININTIVMDGDNGIFFNWNQPDDTNSASAAVSSLTSPGTGNEAIRVSGGELHIIAGEIKADIVLRVKTGARMILDSLICAGEIIVETGGECNLKSIGVLLGDINVEAGAALDVDIVEHTGTITNNGTLNGIIGGVRYGNRIVDIEDTITSETNTDKILQPDGSGSVEWVSPITTYGDAFVTANTSVTSLTQNVWRGVDTDSSFSLGVNNSGFTLSSSDSGEITLSDASFSGWYISTITMIPGASKTYEFRVVKNGNTLPENIVHQTFNGNQNATNLTIYVPIIMTQNDTVELQVRNIDGNQDMTARTVTICMTPKTNNYV